MPVAGPPSPVSPFVPVALPATVYMSPAVMAAPHWVPLAAGTSWTRLFLASAMYRSPDGVDGQRRQAARAARWWPGRRRRCCRWVPAADPAMV